MPKNIRKMVNITEEQYSILKEYSEEKGISMGEGITSLMKEKAIMEANQLHTIIDNVTLFCDQLEKLADVSRLPEWMISNIKTMRPIIIKGMLRGESFDLEAIIDSWERPGNIKFAPEYEIVARA